MAQVQFNVRAESDLIEYVARYCESTGMTKAEFFRRAALKELLAPVQARFAHLGHELETLFGPNAELWVDLEGRPEGEVEWQGELKIANERDEVWKRDTREIERVYVSSDHPDVMKMALTRFYVRISTSPVPDMETSEFIHVDLVLDVEQPHESGRTPHSGRYVARLATQQAPSGQNTGRLVMGLKVSKLSEKAVLTHAAGQIADL